MKHDHPETETSFDKFKELYTEKFWENAQEKNSTEVSEKEIEDLWEIADIAEIMDL
jgi:hypothetical protein